MLNVDNSLALMNSSFKPNDIKIQSENDLLLKEQTDKFEAFFIKKILDISLTQDDSSKLFGKDAGDKIYNSMYNDALSDSMSGKFGFSELLFNYLKENN
ncbi:MAG: peptidoglycan hydrolase FlgJ [Sulfurospirillum sp.]|jgi:Rod binding domain-containing protein|nr:peptidoglycan hydrolase FlgJ [Sulfurospirillum sp.]DAB34129.1 MAG TPA: rod-binding protein [Sulfurospirillum sp. UBA12182]